MTDFLTRPEGRVAYDVAGEGPLVLLVPGMGELRTSYRFVAPALREAGFRVAVTDLRGHGDSDTTFSAYGDADIADDVVALIEELGGSAVVVGNSIAGGSAVIAAAARPELVRGLALLDPFVRNPPAPEGGESGEAPTIDADFWQGYLPSLYAGHRPDDFDEYLDSVIESLRRPGYTEAFAQLVTTIDHTPAEERLGEVKAPTLVVMGELDPDFADPRAEADWVAGELGGEVVMIADAGHYPQAQQPAQTTDALLRFLNNLTS